MHTPHDPLDHFLERWRDAPPPLPGPLAPEVWRRIALGEPVVRPSLLARIEAAFARPSFAVAFVTACMLLGLFIAEMRLSRLQAERNAQLALSYLHLIDPLLDGSANRSVAAAPHS
jgi:hypothetical protein